MAGFEMSRIDLRGRTLSAAQLRAALPRGGVDVDAVVPKVRPIVDAVAERGAAAALEYGQSFDVPTTRPFFWIFASESSPPLILIREKSG